MATHPELEREYSGVTLPEQEFSEHAPEKKSQPENAGDALVVSPPVVVAPALPVSPGKLVAPKSQAVQEIESILAEDLEGIYASLDGPARTAFRLSGEQAAQKISEVLQSASVQFMKIIKIISDWLRTIPGINWAFVEQETKVKTAKLLKLTDKHDDL